jgi:transposase InsO family protein
VGVAAREQAVALVRELHGVIGVEALRRSCAGLTRRTAAALKHDTLTAIERERRTTAARVEVAAPGVVRGFDSMHLRSGGHLLMCADGSLPYRTSWTLARRYDGRAVARALADDFTRNGAPLVLRLDRARQHDVAAVRAILERHGVLPLHGPPRHPQYYGQLERLNRDQRAWLGGGTCVDVDGIDGMMTSLNSSWRRRRLGWSTAREAWDARAELDTNRAQMRTEVENNCEHLVADEGVPRDLAWRLAVEQALKARGFLRVVSGGGC